MAGVPRKGSLNDSQHTVMPYEYMFGRDKAPTQQLDALLRAIAIHIINEIGDKSDRYLTPPKLAAFYKAVGGDYDSLFVDTPYVSISYVWQVTGCQHALQPTDDDFAAPSIPSLTLRGFSRWESLEILLGPEEHVPFLQFAVQNWDLKHPDSGASFPPALPREVFPQHADADVDRWHKSCAERLRKEASKTANQPSPKVSHSGGPQHDISFAHVKSPFAGTGPARDKPSDPDHRGGSLPYAHVAPRSAPVREPVYSPPDRRKRDSPAVAEVRRKSFTDYRPRNFEQLIDYRPDQAAHTAAKAATRRPTQLPESSDEEDSSEEAGPLEVRPKRRPHADSNPSSSGRRAVVPPTAPQPPSAVNPPPFRSHRSDMRDDGRRHRSGSSPMASLRSKHSDPTSNSLPLHSRWDRYSTEPPHGTYNGAAPHGRPRPRRSREQAVPPSRLARGYSGDLSESESSNSGSDDEEDDDPTTHSYRTFPDDRDRGLFDDVRARRGSDRSEREEGRDGRPSGGRRRDRGYGRRMSTQPHLSSYPDIMEQQQQHPRSSRDRHRDVMREAPHPAKDRDRGRNRRQWDRERDRGSSDERGDSPMTGVTGRRYAEPLYL